MSTERTGLIKGKPLCEDACMLQWLHSGLVNFKNRKPKGIQVRLEGLGTLRSAFPSPLVFPSWGVESRRDRNGASAELPGTQPGVPSIAGLARKASIVSRLDLRTAHASPASGPSPGARIKCGPPTLLPRGKYMRMKDQGFTKVRQKIRGAVVTGIKVKLVRNAFCLELPVEVRRSLIKSELVRTAAVEIDGEPRSSYPCPILPCQDKRTVLVPVTEINRVAEHRSQNFAERSRFLGSLGRPRGFCEESRALRADRGE